MKSQICQYLQWRREKVTQCNIYFRLKIKLLRKLISQKFSKDKACITFLTITPWWHGKTSGYVVDLNSIWWPYCRHSLCGICTCEFYVSDKYNELRCKSMEVCYMFRKVLINVGWSEKMKNSHEKWCEWGKQPLVSW